MNREQAIAYLTGTDWRASRLGLERMAELLDRLGNPEKSLRFIHIAGTNGKGSTAALCASMLAAAGYKTGLYTSPFLQRFEERIRVNGEQIPEQALVGCTDVVRRQAEAMADHPTEFELVTAVGYVHFLREKCDVVVLETGLGGRLDATNTIGAPLLAVVTPVGYDHIAELGDTLKKIALEKAGIIKPGGDVLLCPQAAGADAVFSRVCKERSAKLHRVDMSRLSLLSRDLQGQRFSFGELENLEMALLGAYQLENSAAALSAMEILRSKGFELPGGALRKGLAAARWPARFELLGKLPPFVLDGAHNPAGAAALGQTLAIYFPGQKVVFVCGVLADKDWKAIVRSLAPLAKRAVCVRPNNPRALPAHELAAGWREAGLADVSVCEDLAEGLELARQSAGETGVVCVFGSLYMAGEVRTWMESRGRE